MSFLKALLHTAAMLVIIAIISRITGQQLTIGSFGFAIGFTALQRTYERKPGA